MDPRAGLFLCRPVIGGVNEKFVRAMRMRSSTRGLLSVHGALLSDNQSTT